MTLQDQPKYVSILNGAEYIPIGVIENTLDEIDPSWSTSDFKFTIYSTPVGVIADASIQLCVSLPDGYKNVHGSCSMLITGTEDNKDYSATCQSFAISNAAKRMGIVFGRGLNDRLKTGEAIPDLPIAGDQPNPEELELIKNKYNHLKAK